MMRISETVWFQKISIPHHRGSLEIQKGRGVLKAKIFKELYEPKLEFPEGWGGGFKPKKPSMVGSMDIFWNNTFALSFYALPRQCRVVWKIFRGPYCFTALISASLFD